MGVVSPFPQAQLPLAYALAETEDSEGALWVLPTRLGPRLPHECPKRPCPDFDGVFVRRVWHTGQALDAPLAQLTMPWNIPFAMPVQHRKER
jgi:hypothetical protein